MRKIVSFQVGVKEVSRCGKHVEIPCLDILFFNVKKIVSKLLIAIFNNIKASR
jgi:hypothetical protein